MRYLFYILLFSSIESFSQSAEPDSIVLDSEGSERIETLHQIVTDLWLNYPQKAMDYGQEAFQLSTDLGDSVLISKSLRLIAGVYYYKGDYDSSFRYNYRAFEIAYLLKDSTLMNNGFNNLGLLHYNLGSYQTALEYLLQSKQIKEVRGETYGLSTTLNNIGLIYERVGSFETARDYFQQAFQVADSLDELSPKLYSLNNIGLTYLREGDLEKSQEYFQKGLLLSREIENVNWGAASLRGIAELLMEQGDQDSANYYLEEALNASQSIDDKKGLAEVYYLMAKNALLQEEYEKAEEFLDASEAWTKQTQLRQQLLDNLKLFATLYKAKKDLEGENRYLQKYVSLRDSLFQDVVTRNLSLIPVKVNENLDKRKISDQEAEIRNQQLVSRFFTILALITIPFLIILIILLRKNERKKKELIANNEELQRTQKLLITSEKMASLGVLAAGVGHEINNPLNFIKNGLAAIEKKTEESHDDELRTYFKIVNEGVDRASNIVKSLSHFSRRGHSMEERCNLNEIIENCLLILHNQIRNRIRIVTNFAQNAVVKGNEGRLHQAMMNIISNGSQAIKESGTLEITTRRSGNYLEVCIEDDGEGIPDENLSRISDPFFTTKAPGEGTGLGLFITFSIIEEHRGRIEVDSIPEIGSKFIVKLPLS